MVLVIVITIIIGSYCPAVLGTCVSQPGWRWLMAHGNMRKPRLTATSCFTLGEPLDPLSFKLLISRVKLDKISSVSPTSQGGPE